jgi:predicted ribosome quality control (RQC) complex YloA/Tae2 family protein
MDDQSIREIVDEITPLIIHRAPGKIFQLGRASLAIDFGLREAGYLFISADPAAPRMHLIRRRVRDLEKQSTPLTQFSLTLRKELADTQLDALGKDAADRIVRFDFVGRDELGNPKRRVLVVQLTGRSANLLLLGADSRIVQTARKADNEGQQSGDSYRRPEARGESASAQRESELLAQIRSPKSSSSSEAADAYFTSLLAERAFAARASAARTELRKKVAQQQKLLKQLECDLESHEDAEQHKRVGDLLLANLTTGRREGNRVELVDYFADEGSTIQIDLDDSITFQEEANRRFGLYSRSKRAVAQIKVRIAAVEDRLRELKLEQESLEREIVNGDLTVTSMKSEPPALAGGPPKPLQKISGTRRYLSSDGFEILVGRTAQDNDLLTFKVAKPNDLWLHAADYGGSHVVVRNSTKKPIPHPTLIEAAQLAAYFSKAKKDPKVDVHYTERKFVSKVKGGKPGLVRLLRFKNITVEPGEAGTRN